jgi:hypothetical protein
MNTFIFRLEKDVFAQYNSNVNTSILSKSIRGIDTGDNIIIKCIRDPRLKGERIKLEYPVVAIEYDVAYSLNENWDKIILSLCDKKKVYF